MSTARATIFKDAALKAYGHNPELADRFFGKAAIEPEHWETPCALCGSGEGEHEFATWNCPTEPGPTPRKFTKRYQFLPRVRP